MRKLKKAMIITSLLTASLTSINAKPVDRLVININKHAQSETRSKTKKYGSKGVVKTAKKYLGVRYRFGGNTRRGIDCSAFTKVVMKKHGKNLPRTARAQASSGKHIDKKNLRPGDLVFFKNTDRRGGITHVGMMISKTSFIHASSGARKVTITSLNKSYYRKHYAGARRV